MNAGYPCRFLTAFVAANLALLFAACAPTGGAHRNAITLRADADEVVVRTRDGRVITFLQDEYQVVRSDSGKAISGTGRQLNDSLGNRPQPFVGTIAVAEMQDVEYRHQSGGASPVVFLVAGVVVVVLVLLTRTHTSWAG